MDAVRPGRRLSFAASLGLHILCVALLPKLELLMRQPPHFDSAQYEVVRLDYRVPVSPVFVPPAPLPDAGPKGPGLLPSAPSAASTEAPQESTKGNRRTAEAEESSDRSGEQEPHQTTADAGPKEHRGERERYELVLPEFPNSDPALRDIILHPDFQAPLPPEYTPSLPPVVLWALTPAPLLDGAVLEPAKQERTVPTRWELPPAKPKTQPRPALAALAPAGPALSEPPVSPGLPPDRPRLATVEPPPAAVQDPPPLAEPETRNPPAPSRVVEPVRRVRPARARWALPPTEPEPQSPALAEVASEQGPTLSDLASGSRLSPAPPRLAPLSPPAEYAPGPPALAKRDPRNPQLERTHDAEPVERPAPPRWQPPPAEFSTQSRLALADVAPRQGPTVSESPARPRMLPDLPRLSVEPPRATLPSPPALSAVQTQPSLVAVTRNLDLLAASFELQRGYRAAPPDPAGTSPGVADPASSLAPGGETATLGARPKRATGEAFVPPSRRGDPRSPRAEKSALDTLAGPPTLSGGEGRNSLLALSRTLDLFAPSFELRPGYRVGGAVATAPGTRSSPTGEIGSRASAPGQDLAQPSFSSLLPSAAPGSQAAKAVDALGGPPSLAGDEGRNSLIALTRTLDLFGPSFELQPGYRLGSSASPDTPSRKSGPPERRPARTDGDGLARSQDSAPETGELRAESRQPLVNDNPVPGSQESTGSESAASTDRSMLAEGGDPAPRKFNDSPDSSAATPGDTARGDADSTSAVSTRDDSASPAPGSAAESASPDNRSQPLKTRRARGPLQPVPRSRHGIILVSNSRSTLPEAIGILTGNPVYAVYLEVPEAPRKWILQFCVPGPAESRLQFSGGVVRVVPRKELDPPYPLHREPLRLDQDLSPAATQFPERAVVYFTLDEEGEMGNLRIIQGGGPRVDRTILANLETWQFLPAFQEGRPVPVEAIFGIPLQ